MDEPITIPLTTKKSFTPEQLKNIKIQFIENNRQSKLYLRKDFDNSGYYSKYFLDLKPVEEGISEICFTNKLNGQTKKYQINVNRPFAVGICILT